MDLKKVNGILTIVFYLLLVLTVAMFLFYRQTEQRWLYLIPGVVAVAVRVTGYFISSFKR
ncbi:hypothetical protein [Porphyromonas gingivalis]|uniref:Uncharacterized protein n=2 Tax=Porphyromonas gingivalis TaxID=837 RepID=B2RLM8_PORG3|nr:hypothetical protein [Porphyromonas gingivalis]AIJ34559.1 hypothetical protein EG14_00135 [Porphyromonas gingivalis]ALJ26152.1 hypothetical protein PGF_00017350 [Porphyromonas gingivalis 381]ALO30517.1 hypothetical protein PGS_00018540 [Porphyromonas gingivalis A7A1-28]ATR94254.1 hypothetical protein CS546_03970 [Porphyromonas gingivalis]ATR97416.1 hypothetical protein CS548_10345 [Porphyromonas gingivalis]